MLILFGIFVLLFCVLIVKASLQFSSSYIEFDIKKDDNVLFIISHPDDECIFFSPTIQYLTRKQINTSILCLSTGDFYGKGENRIEELFKSCQNLGIGQKNIICVDDFNDNPLEHWDIASVAETEKKFISQVKASAVFTFDKRGVSGHLNHTAAYEGAKYLHENGLIHKNIKIFTLNTVILGRKYIQVLDLLFSLSCSFFSSSTVLIVAGLREYYTGYKSMLCHKTQLVWFRYLIILFSRFLYD